MLESETHKSDWLVIISKPNCEKRAEHHLLRQGFEVYAPKVKTRKLVKRTKRFEWRIGPLFARYIFVRHTFSWGPIRSTIGVSNIVMDSEAPAVLSDKEIKRIKSREGFGGFIELSEPEKFKIGQRLKIISGPFTGQDAIYEKSFGLAGIKALINAFGSQVQIDLMENCVAAA